MQGTIGLAPRSGFGPLYQQLLDDWRKRGQANLMPQRVGQVGLRQTQRCTQATFTPRALRRCTSPACLSGQATAFPRQVWEHRFA